MPHIFTGRRVAIILVTCLLFFVVAYFYLSAFAMISFDNTCRESFDVSTWIDSNGNGIQDNGELPLPYATTAIDGLSRDITAYFRESGSDGIILVNLRGPFQGTFFNLSPDCTRRNQVQAIPIAPEGYHPISTEPQPLNKSLSFGFVPEEGTVLPKPIPSLDCRQFKKPRGDYGAFNLDGMIVVPDEKLFYEYDHFGRYTLESDKVQWFDTGAVFGKIQKIRTVEKGKDDVYWVLLFPIAQPNQRISKLQFKNNKPIQTDIPEPFPETIDITVDSSGNVWAISLLQIAQWDDGRGSWKYFDLAKANISGYQSQNEPDSITFLDSGILVVSSFLQTTFGEYDVSTGTMTWSVLEFTDGVSNTWGSYSDGRRLWFEDVSVYFDSEDQTWQQTDFHSKLALLEIPYREDTVEVIEDALWVASGSVLFYVDPLGTSDRGSWPLYRDFNSIDHISAESPTIIWVNDKDSLLRCEFHIDN